MRIMNFVLKFTMKGVSLIEENTTDAQRTADGYQETW